MNTTRERRALVPSRQNENTNLDFVVSVEFSMPLPITRGEGRLYVRYVPDRVLLDMEDLAPWLTHIEAIEAQEIEQAAVMVFLERQERIYRGAGRTDPVRTARVDLCQALLGMNEFIYVD